MSDNFSGPLLEHIGALQTGGKPLGITDDLPFIIEVEPGSEAYEGHLAVYTSLEVSFVTSLFVTSLNLRRLPVSPAQSRRLYHTPFGLLDLKHFVRMAVQGPQAGIPRISVDIGILDEGHAWRDISLFLGRNFRAKVSQAQARPTDTTGGLPYHRSNDSAVTLPPKSVVSTMGLDVLFNEPAVALLESPTLASSPQIYNPERGDPPRPIMDTFRHSDPELLNPRRPETYSRTTSRPGGTPISTVGEVPFSTPPSTLASRRSHDAISGQSKLPVFIVQEAEREKCEEPFRRSGDFPFYSPPNK